VSGNGDTDTREAPRDGAREAARAPSNVLWREAATVGAVLAVFGFCAMHFFLGERVEKSLIIGLAGGAVGSFRFVTRAVRGRR
jgi:hypothetical protein